MPITAFSASREIELDVNQLLEDLAQRTQQPTPGKSTPIPDDWKTFIWDDIECPACFCRGAEVVRASNSKETGQEIRQAYFRFQKSSGADGHHPFCDFAGNVPADHIPENLVQFSSAKDGVSKAIRELVCRGIQLGVLGQRDIRAMREWYFQRKVTSRFVVILDPRAPKWIESLQRMRAGPWNKASEAIVLSKAIIEIPGFDLATTAREAVTRRHHALLDALLEKRVWMHGTAPRIEKLAVEYQGKAVFDPSSLQHEYQRAQVLATFICRNYAPVASATSKSDAGVSVKGARPLLAFSSLLLFISEWDLNRASNLFAKIASDVSAVDLSLGNVIGLNPFHDFEAWSALKLLQGLMPFDSEIFDAKAEVERWIGETKSTYGALSQDSN
ncbi:hypothetical protein [Pseudomonas fluorescens]|uniref:Uncharacterized protein n=1 Tax=Pseudomonas fluorescens TaxID=294 RepID=A0A0F4V7A0_PSEFL|nr:hypothetical protein [Pseudomonas fluorescens]KJZ64380.1 hypothetical protein VD17_18060 [Pseudomonas fluorescens]